MSPAHRVGLTSSEGEALGQREREMERERESCSPRETNQRCVENPTEIFYL